MAEAESTVSAAGRALEVRELKVWDPLVRIAHWALVVLFCVAYFTEGEEDVLQWHVWAGYGVAGIVAWRVLWGVVGPRHARFTSFVRGPGAIFGYLRGLVSGNAARTLGHNPAGGAMVVLLLLALATTTFSGMALYAVEEGEGPLAGWSMLPAGEASTRGADRGMTSGGEHEDEDDGAERSVGAESEDEGEGEDEGEEWLEEIHEFAANLTLLLVLLHIVGVLISSAVHRENLPRAMVTGRKREA